MTSPGWAVICSLLVGSEKPNAPQISKPPLVLSVTVTGDSCSLATRARAAALSTRVTDFVTPSMVMFIFWVIV